jgi:hypothetical protein
MSLGVHVKHCPPGGMPLKPVSTFRINSGPPFFIRGFQAARSPVSGAFACALAWHARQEWS